MSINLILRIATIEDLDYVEKIYNAAIEMMNSNGINQWDNIYPSKEILKEDILKGEMFLGMVDNKIACAFVLNNDYDEEYNTGNWKYRNESFSIVHRLCVNPDFQNQGIGTQSMMLIEKMLRKDGIESIRLDAFSLNPFALRLYKKIGYSRVGDVNWRKGLFYLYEKKI